MIICIAGLFNLSQSALDALTHKTFEDNPVPVNIFLLGLVLVIGGVLIAYVRRKSVAMAKEGALGGDDVMPSFNVTQGVNTADFAG